jgi:WD40 repeat protein
MEWPLRFSPDGRTFAAVRINYPGPSTIALIDVVTGRAEISLATRYTAVYDLAFIDSGRSLRVMLGDVPDLNVAETWDTATGRQTSSRPLTCPTASCDPAISPDGRLLALAPFSGTTIRIWDLVADHESARLTNRSTGVKLARGLAFSEDGWTLAVSREDGSFEIWDLPTRQLKKTLRGHTGSFVSNGIRIAPDGRTLASRGEFLRPSSIPVGFQVAFSQALLGWSGRPAPEVIVLDIGTGRRLARAAAAVHPFYSPDGATIATRETDFSIRLRPSPARPR